MATDNTPRPSDINPHALALSADPNKAVMEVIDMIENLRRIYIAETAVLAAADTKGFMDIQEKKLKAARLYQNSALILLDRKNELKNKVDPRLTQALAKKQEEFAAVSRDNVNHLERMRACSKRLSDRIMQSARDAVRGNAHCYGARGHLEQNERRVSLSLNESA
jgi:hypothetical protein